MVKVIHLSDDGTETAAVVLDDFTVEVVYSGIADMLRDAATAQSAEVTIAFELPREARQRREKLLARVRH
jgi:hypothetical protein